jgi:NADPH:quinone reductase-like Zn-dependent oxidoreductase
LTPWGSKSFPVRSPERARCWSLVGPWDRLVREGQSGLSQTLPLTLGSEISAMVAMLGADVGVFALGDAVYGATNDQFDGEYALVEAGDVRTQARCARLRDGGGRSSRCGYRQMLSEHTNIEPRQAILVRGAAGSSAPSRRKWRRQPG